MVKRLVLWMAILGLNLTIVTGLTGCGSPAATVNGEPISHKRLDKELEQMYGKEVLDNLINVALVQQAARKEHIVVTPEEVKAKAVKLMQTPNIKVIMEERGVTQKDIEDNLSFIMPLDKLILKNIKEQEKQDFYANNKEQLRKIQAQHILLQDESMAKVVLQEVQAGKDFAELAKKYSKDKVTGAEGGDLGTFSNGEMDENFATAAFALKPGECSGIVHTRFGYHIIKVNKILDSYEAVKEDIELALAEPKRLEYVENLKKNAKIKILL